MSNIIHTEQGIFRMENLEAGKGRENFFSFFFRKKKAGLFVPLCANTEN